MKGNLFIGSLKFGYLARLELSGGKVVREHNLLASSDRPPRRPRGSGLDEPLADGVQGQAGDDVQVQPLHDAGTVHVHGLG
jgi:hypothetical protein